MRFTDAQATDAVRPFLTRVDALTDVERTGGETARVANMIRHCNRVLAGIRQLETLGLFDGLTPTRGAIRPSHLYQRVPPYRRFYRAYLDFLAGLAAGKPTSPTFRDALETQKICDAVLASASEHTWKAVG